MGKQGLPEPVTVLSVPQFPPRSLPTGQLVHPNGRPARAQSQRFGPDVTVIGTPQGSEWPEGSQECAHERGSGSYNPDKKGEEALARWLRRLEHPPDAPRSWVRYLIRTHTRVN